MAAILITLIFVVPISVYWAHLIHNMKENFPDYKGEDFLNWGENEMKKETETNEWDDNQVHTEGGFH
jgi:hypothetical protein